MLLQEAKALQPWLVSLRRTLHQNAEVGFDLPKTLHTVKQTLTDLGYDPQMCGRAGLTAQVGGKRPGATILLRADMDALPIMEQSGESFAAQNGAMHACGHDLHTAMLLGAAKLLKAHENELCGTVKLMFQPAEEIFEGSQDMLQAGLLDAPKVDAAMMLHVMANMPFEPGTVIVAPPGVSAPAADYFEITVQGVGCHGSMPHMGVDSLTAAAHILIALQEISARELAMSDRVVLTIGTFHGGSAANAIADRAVLGGSLRTYDEAVRTQIKTRLEQMAKAIASAYRATASVSFGSGCPTLVNAPELVDKVCRYAKQLLGADRAFSTQELQTMSGGKVAGGSAGSEDFAYVSHRVPSVMLALAAGQPEKGYGYPQHHPMVRFDEAALCDGAAVYANMALQFLSDKTI